MDSCVPGDMVTITAIVKATGSEEGVPSLIPRRPPSFSKLLSPTKRKLVSSLLRIFFSDEKSTEKVDGKEGGGFGVRLSTRL